VGFSVISNSSRYQAVRDLHRTEAKKSKGEIFFALTIITANRPSRNEVTYLYDSKNSYSKI
jgi:hypothetical protein